MGTNSNNGQYQKHQHQHHNRNHSDESRGKVDNVNYMQYIQIEGYKIINDFIEKNVTTEDRRKLKAVMASSANFMSAGVKVVMDGVIKLSVITADFIEKNVTRENMQKACTFLKTAATASASVMLAGGKVVMDGAITLSTECINKMSAKLSNLYNKLSVSKDEAITIASFLVPSVAYILSALVIAQSIAGITLNMNIVADQFAELSQSMPAI